MLKRGSGILLHISSLPSLYGIGDFGPGAFTFVDFLVKAGQRYWQLLPLNPTETIYGNSPYSSPSAFAANILFISPEILIKDGWLAKEDVPPPPAFSETRVHYPSVLEYKNKLLHLAFERFKKQAEGHNLYKEFCARDASWLQDYAAFVGFKKHFEGQAWNTWPEDIRNRTGQEFNHLRDACAEEIEKTKFLQFLVLQQLSALKDYCQQKGIKLIGDIPIYVNYDSADVWAKPANYKLTKKSTPQSVAGVPPDYFSKTGQRWGNPVYDWEALKANGYDWWVQRIQHNLDFFDYVRIDHFRGLAAYWQIPAREKTAVKGKWIPGPGEDLFNSLRENLPVLPIIAEDLGVITPDVTALMDKFGFPGMRILLFGFGGDMKTHLYIPDNYINNCVAYTGTHDNNTIKGWLEHDASDHEKENLRNFLASLSWRKKDEASDHLHWDLIQAVMTSVADGVIFPMQDILGYGQEDRMNTPATATGNWEWRVSQNVLSPDIADKLCQLTKETQRD